MTLRVSLLWMTCRQLLPLPCKRFHVGLPLLPFLARCRAATLLLVPATPCTPSAGTGLCTASVTSIGKEHLTNTMPQTSVSLKDDQACCEACRECNACCIMLLLYAPSFDIRHHSSENFMTRATQAYDGNQPSLTSWARTMPSMTDRDEQIFASLTHPVRSEPMLHLWQIQVGTLRTEVAYRLHRKHNKNPLCNISVLSSIQA